MLRVPRLHIGCAQQFEASTFTPNTCPACERPGDGAVLDRVQARIADYEKVDEETQAAVTAWTTSGWLDLGPLYGAHLDEAEAAQAEALGIRGAKGELSAAEFAALSGLRLLLTNSDRDVGD